MRREQKSQIEEVFETCARMQEWESGITSKFVDGRMGFLRASKQSEASMPPRFSCIHFGHLGNVTAQMARMALNVFDSRPFEGIACAWYGGTFFCYLSVGEAHRCNLDASRPHVARRPASCV